MIKEYEQHNHVSAGRNIDAEYIFFKAYKGYTSILKLPKDEMGRTPKDFLLSVRLKNESILHKLFQIFSKGKLS